MNLRKLHSSSSGLTLLEILVALSISAVVVTGITGMARLGYKAFTRNMNNSLTTLHNSSFDYVFNRDLKNATGLIIASPDPSAANLANMCTTYTNGSTTVRPILTAYLQHTLMISAAETELQNPGQIRYYTTAPHNLQQGMPVTVSGLSPTEFNVTALVADIDTVDFLWFSINSPADGSLPNGSVTSPAYDPLTAKIANGAGVSISYVGYEVVTNPDAPNSSDFLRVECENLLADGEQKIVNTIKYRSDMPAIADWDWSQTITCTPTAPTTFDSKGSQSQPCPLDVPIVMGQKSISTTNSSFDVASQSLLLDNSGNSVSSIAIGGSATWPQLDPSIHALVTSALISNTGNTSTIKLLCYGSAGPTASNVSCPNPIDPIVFMGAMTVNPTANSSFNPVTVNDASRLGVGMYTTGADPLVIQSINVSDVTFWRSPSSLPGSLTFVSCRAITLFLPATSSSGVQILEPFKLSTSRGLS